MVLKFCFPLMTLLSYNPLSLPEDNTISHLSNDLNDFRTFFKKQNQSIPGNNTNMGTIKNKYH